MNIPLDIEKIIMDYKVEMEICEENMREELKKEKNKDVWMKYIAKHHEGIDFEDFDTTFVDWNTVSVFLIKNKMDNVQFIIDYKDRIDWDILEYYFKDF